MANRRYKVIPHPAQGLCYLRQEHECFRSHPPGCHEPVLGIPYSLRLCGGRSSSRLPSPRHLPLQLLRPWEFLARPCLRMSSRRGLPRLLVAALSRGGDQSSFVPNIFILILILAILEDSGYLARAAFVMERLMYAIGFPGKSFIPMLIGFGCNVPAIMGSRTIEDKKDRLITILVNPFISCGARLPVHCPLFRGLFPSQCRNGDLRVVCPWHRNRDPLGKTFRATILPGKPAQFLMEMPPSRLPTVKTSFIHMWTGD